MIDRRPRPDGRPAADQPDLELGPYNPSQVSAGTQPDFYMMWTDGLARIWPPWEFYLFGHTIPAVVLGRR